MHSGGLPERTNDRLACAGRLGIRFLSGVLGWSFFALRVHKLGMPTKLAYIWHGVEWDGVEWMAGKGSLKKHSSWRV